MPQWLAAIIAITCGVLAGGLAGSAVGLVFCFLYQASLKVHERAKAHVRTSLAEMDEAEAVSCYRQRFKSAPLGRWSQAVGTFNCVMDEVWEFHVDHTGKVTEYGPFRGKRGELLFEWKEVADYTIACRVTKWPDYLADEDEPSQSGEGEAGQEEVEEEEWDIIRYDFKVMSTDCGDSIVLYQIDSIAASLAAPDAILEEGFWHSLEPLSYISYQ